MCALSNINKMAYFYAMCAVCVTSFSTSRKLRPVSNFTCFTQVAHSYALLWALIDICMQAIWRELSGNP